MGGWMPLFFGDTSKLEEKTSETGEGREVVRFLSWKTQEENCLTFGSRAVLGLCVGYKFNIGRHPHVHLAELMVSCDWDPLLCVSEAHQSMTMRNNSKLTPYLLGLLVASKPSVK